MMSVLTILDSDNVAFDGHSDNVAFDVHSDCIRDVVFLVDFSVYYSGLIEDTVGQLEVDVWPSFGYHHPGSESRVWAGTPGRPFRLEDTFK